MKTIAAAVLSSLLLACARGAAEEEAAVTAKTIEYRHGEAVLEGFLARPAGEGPHPGVLILHAWRGIGDHEREWAERLAGEGYVAFAADVYGKGIRPTRREDAAAQAGKYRGDRPLLRERAAAGLAELRKQEGVDPKRLFAIGFCFGGGAALELARSGADVAGVVSLHGNLDTPDPKIAERIRGKVLVLHGAADPHVPAAQVQAFMAEMHAAKVDWRMIAYGGAVHSFTDPGAGNDPSTGGAYDERTARRAWNDMLSFFREER